MSLRHVKAPDYHREKYVAKKYGKKIAFQSKADRPRTRVCVKLRSYDLDIMTYDLDTRPWPTYAYYEVASAYQKWNLYVKTFKVKGHTEAFLLLWPCPWSNGLDIIYEFHPDNHVEFLI